MVPVRRTVVSGQPVNCVQHPGDAVGLLLSPGIHGKLCQGVLVLGVLSDGDRGSVKLCQRVLVLGVPTAGDRGSV